MFSQSKRHRCVGHLPLRAADVDGPGSGVRVSLRRRGRLPALGLSSWLAGHRLSVAETLQFTAPALGTR